MRRLKRKAIRVCEIPNQEDLLADLFHEEQVKVRREEAALRRNYSFNRKCDEFSMGESYGMDLWCMGYDGDG